MFIVDALVGLGLLVHLVLLAVRKVAIVQEVVDGLHEHLHARQHRDDDDQRQQLAEQGLHAHLHSR